MPITFEWIVVQWLVIFIYFYFLVSPNCFPAVLWKTTGQSKSADIYKYDTLGITDKDHKISLQILTTRFALLKYTLSFVSSDPNVCSDVLLVFCLQLNIKLLSGWTLPAPSTLLIADLCDVSKKKTPQRESKKPPVDKYVIYG